MTHFFALPAKALDYPSVMHATTQTLSTARARFASFPPSICPFHLLLRSLFPTTSINLVSFPSLPAMQLLPLLSFLASGIELISAQYTIPTPSAGHIRGKQYCRHIAFRAGDEPDLYPHPPRTHRPPVGNLLGLSILLTLRPRVIVRKTTWVTLACLLTRRLSTPAFPGNSGSFGGALWALDWSPTIANNNFTSALFHMGGQHAYYNPFTPPPANQSSHLQRCPCHGRST
jgi:hypothetical protein